MTDTIEQSPSRQADWMRAIRNDRDRAAFGELFDLYAPRLATMAARSGIAPEGFVEEVMLAVWRRAALFDPHCASVPGWVYQIARDRLAHIRHGGHPLPGPLAPGTLREDHAQIEGLDRDAGRLGAALSGLTADQRDRLERSYFGETAPADIRVETALPLGVIRARLRLGLERPRQDLKGTH